MSFFNARMSRMYPIRAIVQRHCDCNVTRYGTGRRRIFISGCRMTVVACVAFFAFHMERARAGEIVFPGESWSVKEPRELGLDSSRIDAVAHALGSRGCIIKNGYVVRTWGSQSEKGDWASSAKPVLSTLLMFALKERKVKSFDQPIADFGWPLLPKDRAMTFRHLACMTSGYARPEMPGKAWAYNDYAIQLYQKTLFDKVFQGTPETVFHDPNRFGALQLQDGFTFRKSNRRMRASVRDFARIAWFWLNRGNWNGHQILPRAYFDENMKPQVPKDFPISIRAKTNDYLGIGTYGGDSNRSSRFGPGIYGFNWWFNDMGSSHPNTLTWPDAPRETVMSLGVRGNCSLTIPSLNLVVVAAYADWGDFQPGRADSVLNQRLKLIASAGTPLCRPVRHSLSRPGRRTNPSTWPPTARWKFWQRQNATADRARQCREGRLPLSRRRLRRPEFEDRPTRSWDKEVADRIAAHV